MKEVYVVIMDFYSAVDLLQHLQFNLTVHLREFLMEVKYFLVLVNTLNLFRLFRLFCAVLGCLSPLTTDTVQYLYRHCTVSTGLGSCPYQLTYCLADLNTFYNLNCTLQLAPMKESVASLIPVHTHWSV